MTTAPIAAPMRTAWVDLRAAHRGVRAIAEDRRLLPRRDRRAPGVDGVEDEPAVVHRDAGERVDVGQVVHAPGSTACAPTSTSSRPYRSAMRAGSSRAPRRPKSDERSGCREERDGEPERAEPPRAMTASCARPRRIDSGTVAVPVPGSRRTNERRRSSSFGWRRRSASSSTSAGVKVAASGRPPTCRSSRRAPRA